MSSSTDPVRLTWSAAGREMTETFSGTDAADQFVRVDLNVDPTVSRVVMARKKSRSFGAFFGGRDPSPDGPYFETDEYVRGLDTNEMVRISRVAHSRHAKFVGYFWPAGVSDRNLSDPGVRVACAGKEQHLVELAEQEVTERKAGSVVIHDADLMAFGPDPAKQVALVERDQQTGKPTVIQIDPRVLFALRMTATRLKDAMFCDSPQASIS